MKKFSIFSVFFIFLGVLTCVSTGYFFSSIILSSNIFQFANVITTEKQVFYGLSMMSSAQKDEVETEVKSLQSQNGGGVIFEKDERFYLLASAYENRPDAEKVLKNLNLDGLEIVEIECEKMSIEGNFSSDEKTILSLCLKSKTELFKSLYDVAISLDTNLIDVKKAKLDCNNIFSKHIENKTNLEILFKNNSKEIENLKLQMSKFENILSNLIAENYSSASQTFSSLIKESYLKILTSTLTS